MMVKVGDTLPCSDGEEYRITALELVLIDVNQEINFYVAELEDEYGEEYTIALGVGPHIPVICPRNWFDTGRIHDPGSWVVMETGLHGKGGPANV